MLGFTVAMVIVGCGQRERVVDVTDGLAWTVLLVEGIGPFGFTVGKVRNCSSWSRV